MPLSVIKVRCELMALSVKVRCGLMTLSVKVRCGLMHMETCLEVNWKTSMGFNMGCLLKCIEYKVCG